jgi:hypothetical protein
MINPNVSSKHCWPKQATTMCHPASSIRRPQVYKDAADSRDLKSPETYIGYKQAENFISGPLAYDVSRVYDISAGLELNQLGVGWDMDGWR